MRRKLFKNLKILEMLFPKALRAMKCPPAAGWNLKLSGLHNFYRSRLAQSQTIQNSAKKLFFYLALRIVLVIVAVGPLLMAF
jgi:hypothetical protein